MADLNKIIDELSTLTVVEAAELSKQLEENGRCSCSCGSSTSGGAVAPAGKESQFSLWQLQAIKKLMLLKK